VSARRAAVLAAAALVTAGPQDGSPRYTAASLDCSRWSETSRSEIQTSTSGRIGKATVSRDGMLSVRAADTTGGVSVEGWYDLLALRRRTGEDELAPDTDGLIGGRYRGVLGARGDYAALARPFVPDEVSEVAELAGAFEDLFPALPPRALTPGASWGDSALRIRRLADTVVAGHALQRFGLTSRRVRRETIPHGDTVPVPIRQTISEQGEFTWDSAGLQRRTRTILIETTIPPSRRIPQAVRSRVEQQVELLRLPGGRCE
jgi:hypothetical protein